MSEIMYLGLVIGVLVLAYKIGVDAERRQALQNISDRISEKVETHSIFASRHKGIRGGYLAIDYLLKGAKTGIGYNSPVDGRFVVVNAEDFERFVSDTEPLERSGRERVPNDSPETVATALINEAALKPELTLQPSPTLAAMIGSESVTKTEAVKKVWDYVEARGLREPKAPTYINCDENLEAITGARRCSMIGLAKSAIKHLEQYHDEAWLGAQAERQGQATKGRRVALRPASHTGLWRPAVVARLTEH